MSHLFIAGQVRAQEAKLLTLNRLDRMIGAKSAEDAFRVMAELQYSEYLEDNTTSKKFESVIQKGLLETKELLMTGTDNDPILRFIWLRFDINNLKRALKLKLIEEKTGIDEFSEANGFSMLGRWDQVKVEAIVFGGVPTNIENELQQVIQNAEELYVKNKSSFLSVEYALDQAYFSILHKIVKSEKNKFAKDLFKLLVDQANFRNIARSIMVRNEKVSSSAWIPFGSLYYSDVKNIESVDELIKWAEKTQFSDMVSHFEEAENSKNLVLIEKLLDKDYQKFLEQSTLGEIDSIQIPFVYMEKRLQNSRLLKFIMFAKFHGLTPDEIYNTLKKF